MAYLGLSPDTGIPPPPSGSIVPGESVYAPPQSSDGRWFFSDGKWYPNEAIYLDPVEREMPIIRPEVRMTPQQIEAQVKREQSPMTLYVIGAIAAYLLLMR